MILGRSKAGHDIGEIYVILKEEKGNYLLANGKNRTMEAPKKKNKKHIQLIKNLPDRVKEILPEDDKLTDLVIKRMIRLYQEEENCQKQM